MVKQVCGGVNARCESVLRATAETGADADDAWRHFVPSENSLRVMAEELSVSGRNGLLEKLLGRRPKRAFSTPIRYRRVDCERQLSFKRDDHAAVLHGHAGGVANGAGRLADCPRGRRDAERAPAAGALRAGGAIQPHSLAQHDAGGRGRRDDFPGDSGVLHSGGRLRWRWRGSLFAGCWRTWGCRRRGRMYGRRKSKKAGTQGSREEGSGTGRCEFAEKFSGSEDADTLVIPALPEGPYRR